MRSLMQAVTIGLDMIDQFAEWLQLREKGNAKTGAVFSFAFVSLRWMTIRRW